MNICLLGWYGTETLGDRAILDGIFKILEKCYGDFNLFLGSLYPVLTRRTLLEDKNLYTSSEKKITIEYFDVKIADDLTKKINDSDIVMMGGGPIMGLSELKIIAYAFKLAKKRNKQTIILGCGIGPLSNKEHILYTKTILTLADKIILRDKLSEKVINNILGDIFEYKTRVIQDPAVISALVFKKSFKLELNNNFVINFRTPPTEEYGNKYRFGEKDFQNIIEKSSEKFDKVILVPMHTFFIGGDDRVFYYKLLNNINLKNVEILSKPLSLEELYAYYGNAKECLAMRYHAVVLQTILNGNNYILDYTDSQFGKISGFLQNMNIESTYLNRKINMSSCMELDKEKFLNRIIDNDNKIDNKFELDMDKALIREFCEVLRA